MYKLYKADQHAAYGDSQYITVHVDDSSQGWSVGTQYTVYKTWSTNN